LALARGTKVKVSPAATASSSLRQFIFFPPY
jgi:hypothetical protein